MSESLADFCLSIFNLNTSKQTRHELNKRRTIRGQRRQTMGHGPLDLLWTWIQHAWIYSYFDSLEFEWLPVGTVWLDFDSTCFNYLTYFENLKFDWSPVGAVWFARHDLNKRERTMGQGRQTMGHNPLDSVWFGFNMLYSFLIFGRFRFDWSPVGALWFANPNILKIKKARSDKWSRLVPLDLRFNLCNEWICVAKWLHNLETPGGINA